jgi:hypothetical protein
MDNLIHQLMASSTEAGDETAREANIQQVADYIQTNSKGNAVIVGGDTNSRYTRSEDNIRVFQTDNGLTDAWVQLEKSGKAPSQGGADLLCDNPSPNNTCETVDKVFYRGSNVVRISATSFAYDGKSFLQPNGSILSDHDPVLIDFSWTLSTALRQSNLFGGPTGTWYNDLSLIPQTPKIASITARGASRLDALSFSLADGIVLSHGGTGGTASSLALAANEFVTQAQLCEGQYNGNARIFSVKMTTSAGRTVQAGTSTNDCLVSSAPAGWQIVGMFGRDGDEMDQLGFIYVPQ